MYICIINYLLLLYKQRYLGVLKLRDTRYKGLPAHDVVFIFFTTLWGILRSPVFKSFGEAIFILNK